VDTAKAAYDTAQAKLASVTAGATQAEIAAAENTVASARSALAKTKGATAEEIALAEETVKTNEASVKKAQIDLDNATIIAPFDGTIATIGANVGEQASSGTAMFTIIDTSAIRVDVNVPEADVASIAVGKPATITFDALSNQTFQGTVIAISPTATVSQGVASYLVSISIDPKGLTIPTGLSASASIISAQKDNVLVVSSRAVRNANGNRSVEVMTPDGKTEVRTVQVGLSGDAGIEITSGLIEGEQVVIRNTTTGATQTNQRGGFGGPGIGGPVMIR
jgi:RND family efflux transporter MFP subunit